MSKRKRRADRGPRDRRPRRPFNLGETTVYEGSGDDPLRRFRDEVQHMWQEHHVSPAQITVGHLRTVLANVPDDAPVVVRDIWMVDAPPVPVDGIGIGRCGDEECTEHQDVVLVIGVPRDEEDQAA